MGINTETTTQPFTPEQLDFLRSELRKVLLGDLKKEPEFTREFRSHREITKIARSVYNPNHRTYEDFFVGAFSNIIRNVFDVSRLNWLYGENLDQAIELAKELAEVVKKYSNVKEQ